MPVNKPPDLPRWATGAAVMSEPPEGVKDTGFVPGTDAAAAHVNWLLNQLYQWIQYVDDPATFIAQSLQANALTINPGGAITAPTIDATGDVTVGGALGVGGALTASGGLTVPSGQTAALQGNATVGGTLGVTGATTLDGSLGVSGALNASGGVTVPSGQTAALQGNATVGGTLGVTGATTLGGTLGVSGALTASGGLTVPSGQTAALQGNATVGGTLGVTGATTLGSTLGVTGALTASGGLTVPSGQTASLQGNATVGGTLTVTGGETVGGTLGVTGLVTGGGFTASANQHVTISGTGDYKHGEKILQLPSSAGNAINVSDGGSGYPATGATGWKHDRSVGAQAMFWYAPAAANQEVHFPITLKIGDRIKAVACRVQDTSSGHTISMFLHKSVASSSFFSGSAQVGATQTSGGAGVVQTLTLSGLTATIASFEMYNVILRANGSSFTNHRILGVQVTYDRP